jgi:hypothetical protein
VETKQSQSGFYDLRIVSVDILHPALGRSQEGISAKLCKERMSIVFLVF